MRKLLITSLLLVGTSLCAQINVVTSRKDLVSNRNHFMQNVKLQSLDHRIATYKAVEKFNKLSNLSFKAPMAKAAEENAYLAIACACVVDNAPAFFDVTIQIDGTAATLKGILPYRGIADVTGTVSGNEIKITKEQKVLTLRSSTGEELEGLLSEFDLSNGNMSDIVFKQENGRYVYVPSSESHVVLLYGLVQGKPAVLEGFSDFTINLPQNLVPEYMPLSDLWYYGLSEEGYSLSNTGASVPSEQGSIQWLSYVSAFSNPSYSVNWSYTADDVPVTPEVNAKGVLDMKLDSSVKQYSFPTVTATSGAYTNEYGVDGFISVNTSSLVETNEGIKDFGFSLSNINNKLTYANLFGDYFYGDGTIPTETGDVEKVGVVSIYQDVPSLKFSTINVAAGVSATSFGKKLSLEIRELVPQGDQLAISESVLAKSEITLAENENYAAFSEDWGIITFTNFVGDEGGFEVPLDEIVTGNNFALILNGVGAAKIGVAMDAVPNYAAAVLSAPESAYSLGADGQMYSLGTYSDLCIYFYGSQFVGTGISETSIAQDIVVISNGMELQLSYPADVNSVQVINVAGQIVSEYSLEGTSATIPAANLAKGLYLLKFNTGATVKVMK